MNRLSQTVLSVYVCLGCVPSAFADGPDARKTIKVCRVGSSSFSYQLFEQAKAIAEASGKFKLVSGPDDGAGYTRLDDWVNKPGLYEEWCERTLPKIRDGHYDFVIMQTIGWCGLTPQQQMKLCAELLPDVAQQIREAGTQVVLYDKYMLGVMQLPQNSTARTWAGRYPDGERLNYLLHIYAAKRSGFDKITFGGAVVNALRDDEHFKRMDFLFASGHPSVFSNYITAVNLAYLLTGEDPVGNPAREMPMQGWSQQAFAKLAESDRPRDKELYEANKHRVHDGIFTLSDEEARVLQEAAMASQRKWGAVLHKNLESDETFEQTVQEIKRLQGEMDKFSEYGLDADTVQRLTEQYAPAAAPGEVTPSQLKTIRAHCRSIHYAEIEVRHFISRNLDREQAAAVQADFVKFWDQYNSKLRDDVLFEAKLYQAQMEIQGNRDEFHRMSEMCYRIRLPFALSAFKVTLDHVDDKQAQDLMSCFRIHTPAGRGYPVFAAYQTYYKKDRARLIESWDILLDIWTDPDLMDRLKASKFSADVVLEADQQFKRRIEKLHGPLPADMEIHN